MWNSKSHNFLTRDSKNNLNLVKMKQKEEDNTINNKHTFKQDNINIPQFPDG